MEAASAAYLHGGHCRAGSTQFAPEKKADHFIVEDLLDFSNDQEEEDDAVEGNSSTDSSTINAVNSFNSSSSSVDNGASRSLAYDLCEPYEELAELEWLSNFVEDSFSSEDFQKLHHITGMKSTSYSAPDSESRGNLAITKPVTSLRPEPPATGKARSKRSRAAPSSWSSEFLVLLPSPASFSESELLVEAIAGKKTAKSAKKRDPAACRALAAAHDGRKCLHCATDKTPQWRTGPMGPKTLCNACGVRYKSGRLVPEYRPAASPTFVLSKHSNSHRKVLELRRQKELQPQPHQQQHIHSAAAIFDGAPSESGDDFLIHQHIAADFCD
ncbi:GATA transcription factor 9-like [Typha latifolia]|uniref:GATA transcription factor 9-like n=1 Tax=Typha latifolia TaxID=4733 RepID=UPI003C2F729D